MKKVYLSWNNVQQQTNELLRQMAIDCWRPDYVVGINRGGLVPCNLISQYLDVPMYTLDVRLRDGDSGPESNLWMAEDAFGYNYPEVSGVTGARWDLNLRKKILIVDDINDSGATINWIKQDWQSSCLPGEDSAWNTVWGNTVRVAVLFHNESSECELVPNYSAVEINKFEDPQWIVFPWEDWWSNTNSNKDTV